MPFWNRWHMYVRINFITCHYPMDWAVGCHLGRDKTIEKVSSRFYWRYMKRSENLFSTASSAKIGTPKSNSKLHPIVPVPNVRHQVGLYS